MHKTCTTCYYGKGSRCSIMKEKQIDCFAWADEKEARKRAEDIRHYMSGEVDVIQRNRIYERPIFEILDKDFSYLYEQGLNDVEIAKKLGASKASVLKYRQKLELPANKKRRPTAIGTA